MSEYEGLRAAALAAAARGWPVFPLRPGGKKPVIRRWPEYASTDIDRIRRWWSWSPRFNVAITTGPSSGLYVIDLDANHLRCPATDLDHAVAQLTARLREPAPPTFTVVTPGGWHLYFRAPAGPRLPCTIGRLAPGIDSRGHGGYIVAPGSITPTGTYRVVNSRPIADLPTTLIELLDPPPRHPPPVLTRPVEHPDAYLAAILHGEADRVAHARPGTRNLTVFRSALVLGRLVAANELNAHHARTVLLDAARGHIGVEGFTATELDRTIANGFGYVAKRPRRLNH